MWTSCGLITCSLFSWFWSWQCHLWTFDSHFKWTRFHLRTLWQNQRQLWTMDESTHSGYFLRIPFILQTQKLTNKEQVSAFTQFFISPFLMHGDPAVRTFTCQLISKYAEVEPLRGLNFLTLLLHQLGREQVHKFFSWKNIWLEGSPSSIIDPLYIPIAC